MAFPPLEGYGRLDILGNPVWQLLTRSRGKLPYCLKMSLLKQSFNRLDKMSLFNNTKWTEYGLTTFISILRDNFYSISGCPRPDIV